ncbi:MAG TPA: VOC family protein [Luteibacter sp.]|jgi:PhnB protein|nr:VOC family protein [Luteibacter sp.]
MRIQPYLMFNGNCEEAMKFYEKALGGKIAMLMRYKDMPPQEGGGEPPEGCAPMSAADEAALGEKVMHASLQVGDQVLMASDSHPRYGYKGIEGVSIALGFDGTAEAGKVFDALSDGASIQMPLTETFWSESFGMLTDKFGVPWMINAEGSKKIPT